MSYAPLSLLIDGHFIGGDAAEAVLNPATGDAVGEVPHASTAQLDEAVTAATRAFPAWAATTPRKRSAILRRAAEFVRERRDHIARLLTIEEGKTLPEALGEIDASADVFDWYAEEGRRAYGRVVTGAGATRHLVLAEPIGPCAAFTPWNFPALTPVRKIAGALGAGCTLVLKPSEETPATALELARALVDAGLPAGVLNIVFGLPSEVSERVIGDKRIRKISFTGSTAVGKHLSKLAADNMTRTTMELGGNAPFIVFADADVEMVAKLGAGFKYRNAGQVCISPQRFLVQESAYDKFAETFAAAARAHTPGDGLEKSSTMGPVANARRVDAIEAVVADARAHGAKVAAGGERMGNQGYFHQPTVLLDVPDDALAMTHEIFGPVAALAPFRDLDHAIERANSTPMGLAAYAFTGSAHTASALIDRVQMGMLGLNSVAISTPEVPFGGVKESGHGSEGGLEGLAAYQVTKQVAWS